jgi:L-threonylcarbamoyladenylate synthase
MPNNPLTLAIITGAGGALAVTSANHSGCPEARSADEVRAQFGTRLGAIVDGGDSPESFPSTVVDATGPSVTVLRAGALDPRLIEAALGADRRE